jgi:hypothetical protein
MNSLRMRYFATMLFVVPFMAAHAQWSSDPASNNPICRAGNIQKATQLISDGKGGAFICWTDERSASNFYRVYAQRIDKDGFVRWTENGVAVSPVVESQAKPEIVSDDAGGIIVVWADKRNGTSDIFAQRIDSSGNLLWTADGVPVATGGNEQMDPVLAGDGQHGAIVAWSAHTPAAQDGHIYAQRLNANGNLLWSPELALSTSDQYEMAPCIASDGSGGAYIAWAFYNNQEYDIYAQRVSPGGFVHWQFGGICYTPPSGAQDTPSIIADGAGKAFITYHDWTSGSTPTVQVVVVNPDGTTAASLRPTSTTGGQRNPRMTIVGTGLIGIAWEDGRTGGKPRAYAQIIDNAGQKSWAADGIAVSNRTGNQVTPFVISDGIGGLIVCWEDMTAGITESDLYAQRISAAGTPLWSNAGAPLGTAGRMQQTPCMTGDGQNGAIVAWEDYRVSFSNPEIYASRILADGTFPIAPPILSFSSKTVAFGAVNVGSTSTKSITLTNTGGVPVTIASVIPSDPHFTLTPDSNTIFPKGSIAASVRFQPTSKDTLRAFIVVQGNSFLGPDTIRVTGSGIAAAAIQTDKSALNFGNVITGTSMALALHVSNPGNDTLIISSITADDPSFTVDISSKVVAPGDAFDDTVRFSPAAPGAVTASLTLTSNAPNSPTVVALSGTGTAREVTLTIDHTYLYFGDVTLGSSKDTTLTVTNTGNDTLRMTSFASDDPHFTLETPLEAIAPAGSRTFTLRFAPTATGALSTYFVLMSNASTSPDTIGVQGMGVDVSAVRSVQVVPGAFTLFQNYPNPFRPFTTIRYDLETSAPVRVTVHDALGRIAATLVDETQHPGIHSVQWTPTGDAPGVYFLVVRVGAQTACGRMVLMQ